MAQQVLQALQQVAEQTAQLHRQFLQGQERALEIFQQVLGGGGPAASVPPRPVSVPAAVLAPAAVVTPPPPPAATPPTPPLITKSPEPPPPKPEAHLKPEANLAATLREIIASKTGYPAEMLELDMELDADLGIDSIKRVEIFAAVQERIPSAPPIKPEHLGRLRTLREVLDHLTVASPAAAPPSEATPTATADPVLPTLLAIIAAKTGYPAEMLGLDMELDADLGIDSIKRVEIFAAVQEQLPEAPAIKPEHLGGLRTLRQIADFLAAAPAHQPAAAATPLPAVAPVSAVQPVAAAPAATLARYVPQPVSAPPLGPKLRWEVGAEWWILEDDDGLTAALAQALRDRGHAVRLETAARYRQIALPPSLAGLILAVDRRHDPEATLPELVSLLSHLQAALQGGGMVAALTRLDGRFGWHDARTITPWSAALAGLVKSARHELTGVHAKVVDVPSELARHDETARALADELTHQGPLEVGLDHGQRWTVGLTEAPLLAAPSAPLSLSADDVVLITGGARGVTAACARALAQQTRAQLLILGRTVEPEPEPDWLRPLSTAAQVQAALLRQPQAEGWTPKRLQQHVAQIMTGRELRNNLTALRALGANVVYEAVDVRDPGAVAAVLQRAQRDLGPIRAVIHGAGVLADRRLADLSPDDVRLVWSTKVKGLENLLSALKDGLRYLLLFSSTTARFGRAGQAAYAMANEALNKLACQAAAKRPGCQVRALNWGPWDGGMVTDALKPLFQREGIALIPLAAGATHLLQEMEASSGPEVVVLGGPLPASLREPELAVARPAEPAPLLRRPLSVTACPILADHVLKGRAVVPAALMMDWLAQAALQRHPGLAFHGFNDFRVLKGITLEAAEERTLELHASAAERDNGSARAEVRLATAGAGKPISHAAAQVILATQLPAARTPTPRGALRTFHLPLDQVYADWLFHGPALQALRQLQVEDESTLQARVRLAPPPRDWIMQPWRGQWICDPLAIDAGFQLAIIWTQWQRQMPCLPAGFGRYRQFVRHFPGGEADVRLEVQSQDGAQLRARLTWLTPAGHLLAEMDELIAILDAGLAAAFRQRAWDPAAPSL